MSIIFKSTLTVYFLIAVAALSLLSLSLIQSQTAYAEEEIQTQSSTEVENPIGQTEEETATETADIENQTSAFQFGNYTYRAEKGDNLTYFARRSIQLYLQTSEFNLQTSQIIAAETLTVQELGAFELTVGQEVEIEVSLIGRSVYDAYLLDEAAKIRWSAYEPIRESLDHIEPLSTPQTLDFDSQEPAEEAEEAETTENEEEEAVQTGTDEPEINNAVAENDASFYVTMLGVLILIGIVAWVLALSFLRNTKEDGEDIEWEEDDKRKLKEKITSSKLAEKIKTLPKELDKQKEKLKKKSSKPKKARKKIVKKKK